MKRCRCLKCNCLKFPEDHYKKPIVDKVQKYLCSERCWDDYMEDWKNGMVTV